ncbi:MAG: VOC family protein [Deltaproteobacteria bacterium]|nr:VOC family protein [Deltaproteobacteria bacterium]
MAVKPIPEGYHSITPFLTVRGADRAIDFYSRAFGDEVPGMDSRSPSGIYLYVRDADESFRKAVDAGAAVKRPLEDMFWGDRTGSVLDPFGHTWVLATRREDVPSQEMERRGGEFIKKLSERK